MKRYKDCSLLCNEKQNSGDLLSIIMQVSEGEGYRVDRYSSLGNNATLAVFVQEKDLIYSRVILCAKENSVAIINIVPMSESGVSHIRLGDYNKILDYFRDKIFVKVSEEYGNKIKENSENYTLSEIIPKSYPVLETWLNNNPLSGHPLDEERWFDFVISLHENKEILPISDFETFLFDEQGWDGLDIDEFSLKLTSQLDLLVYYDEHR